MRIRLESNEAGDVPRWMAEAVLEYRDPARRDHLVRLMDRKFTQGIPNFPSHVWHHLLSGLAPYTVHNGSVIFDAPNPVAN